MIEFFKDLKDVAPAAGAIIAAISVIVAFIAFAYTRRTNRRRATLDMVLKTFVDKLADIGVVDSEPNIRNKLSRGKFTAVFLLQCLEAIEVSSLRLSSD